MTDDATSPAPLGESPQAPSAPPYRPSYPFLVIVSALSLAADLVTKSWAKSRLEDGKSFDARHIEVIKDHVTLTFAQNKGGAWGLLQNEPESLRRPFFLGISFVAIAFIVSLYRKLTPGQRALKWGLPLVLGGALGNLINRIQFNYVVDFVDVQWDGCARWRLCHFVLPNNHWPVFNVADIWIVVGVGLMAIDMFTPRRPTLKASDLAGSETKTAPIVAADAAPHDVPAPVPEPVPPTTPELPPDPVPPQES